MELRTYIKLIPFGLTHFRQTVHALTDLALQTDKGIVLANHAVDTLRQRYIIIPPLNVIERICAEAVTRANRRIYRTLTESLSDENRRQLDRLLKRKPDSKITWLAWLRQSPTKPNSRQMMEHIDRLKALQALDLPAGIEQQVRQNRLLKITRDGARMTPHDLAKFELERRHASGMQT